MSASCPPPASSTYGVHVLIEGQWVCLEKGLPLNQAKTEGISVYRRYRVPTEVRERNGAVIKRWEPAPGAIPTLRILRSAELLQGSSEVLIEHRSTIYRLRAAPGGSLILQK